MARRRNRETAPSGALEYDGILAMLEEKADGGRVTPSEIAAVRCVLESCAAELGDVWAEA